MGVVRKSSSRRSGPAATAAPNPSEGFDVVASTRGNRHDDRPQEERHEAMRGRRLRQGVAQFPMQILVPEETRAALRQRSEDTGASIRHIILRSLAADGFPVPKLTRRRADT